MMMKIYIESYTPKASKRNSSMLLKILPVRLKTDEFLRVRNRSNHIHYKLQCISSRVLRYYLKRTKYQTGIYWIPYDKISSFSIASKIRPAEATEYDVI